MRAAAHLPDQALLLHLAAELAERLLELFLVANDNLQVAAILQGRLFRHQDERKVTSVVYV